MSRLVMAIVGGLGLLFFGCQQPPSPNSREVSKLISEGPANLRESLKIVGEVYEDIRKNFSKPGSFEEQLEPLSILASLSEEEKRGLESYLDRQCRAGNGIACTEKGFLTEEFSDYRQGCRLGEPVGCIVAGYLYLRLWDYSNSRALFQRGCQLGLEEGCRLASQLSKKGGSTSSANSRKGER